MSNRIILTISLLISNRPDTVRKCLDSLKPLLEQVPSELILVDTGCGETVRGIAKEHTDQIVGFQWCRDFAKARNAGLERARGEWFLYLDDDEWFEDVSSIVRFFRSGEYKAYGVGLYTQRNYLDFDGSEYTELLVGRMIRLEPDIRFVYRIHECFNRAPGMVKKLDAYVHHYGYVYKNREECEAHAMRNISLLMEELRDQPRNVKHILQLAQEYNSINDREKSLQLSVDAIRMARQGPVEGEYCLASLYANEINCYIELGRWEDAVIRGESHLNSSRPDRLAKALMSGRLTAAYLEAGNYEKCLERTKYYWNVYQEYLKDAEVFMEYDTPVTDTCFHPRRLALVLGNGIRAAIRRGEDGLVWQWFQGIGWEGNKAYVDSQMIREILERMPDADREASAGYREMCNVILGHEEWKDFALQVMMQNCGSRETFEERVKTGAAYGNSASEHWFMKLVRLAAAAFLPDGGAGSFRTAESGPGNSYGAAETENAAAKIWSVMEESMPLMEAFDLPGAVRRLGGDNGRIIEGIPFRRWEQGVARYFAGCAWEDSRWWTEVLQEALEPESIRLLAWNGARGISLAGGAVSLPTEKAADGQGAEWESGAKGDMDGVLKGLGEFALWRTALCEKIYRAETIREMPDILPAEDRGAYAVKRLLERVEREEYAEAVGAVREIKDLLPGLGGIMKQCVKWLERRIEQREEERKRESEQAAMELQILGRQIKARIYAMEQAGQYEAALSVADQLKALLPEDEELLRLREQICRKC